MSANYDFEIIVIGGGHAGIEAALAGARMGCRTAMITMSKSAIGRMSCNPAIGGLAKGQIVKEIDALGGEMGYATDQTGIQFRILNRSKGPAVQSRRAQTDRVHYSKLMMETICSQNGLQVIEGEAVDLLIKDHSCYGVKLRDGTEVSANTAIITSGTFLNGLIHIGLQIFPAGRVDEAPAIGLSEKLQSLGIQAGRLKTGTPPRLDGESINFSECEAQYGDDPPPYFSHRTDNKKEIQQSVCYLTYTNESTHNIIRDNLSQSPLYSGRITGIGPRYCPSIEDKVVRFSERSRHQLFLEPEGIGTSEYYLNGFSSSLPAEIQLAALKTVPSLENVRMTRPGYAIEYDFFPPHQLYLSMESKIVANLFFAGQVNGTSGYEEAAAQGIMTGINAVRRIRGEEPFRLLRSEAYIGVLLDDLVTKSTSEPYRMFTSRAEYRLGLRDDNVEDRLLEKGFSLGLISRQAHELYQNSCNDRIKIREQLKSSRVTLEDDCVNPARKALSAFDAIKNPQFDWSSNSICQDIVSKYGAELFQSLTSEIRYAGYISRQDRRIERLRKLENFIIPKDFDYQNLKGLKAEASQKLSKFRPETLGQASRISGVTPGDITVLMVYLHRL